MLNNENKELCAVCGGKCCRHAACILHPTQVEISYQGIKTLFKKGFCFDYWEGDIIDNGPLDKVYYMRGQHKAQEGKIVDASWGGECIFLTDMGCNLSWEERPFQGKSLVPGADKCFLPETSSKKILVLAWRKYQHQIEKILPNFYYSKNFVSL